MRSFAVELDESGQAFLVLASDGVWDVLSPAQACKIVAAALRMHGSASAAAKALAASAARSNLDDVTVTVLWWAL
jgi:serine/threonine protein phosphatase PrpC